MRKEIVWRQRKRFSRNGDLALGIVLVDFEPFHTLISYLHKTKFDIIFTNTFSFKSGHFHERIRKWFSYMWIYLSFTYDSVPIKENVFCFVKWKCPTLRRILCLSHCLLSHRATCTVSVPLPAVPPCAMFCVCPTACSPTVRHVLCLSHCLLSHRAPCSVSVPLSADPKSTLLWVCHNLISRMAPTSF
jgi:hypothetical protein